MSQGNNVQEADRMSVAIHPSETRRPAGRPTFRPRLKAMAVLAGGGVTLLAFTLGAFSFFSDLAGPRAKPVRIAPVASQWPDLKDGVPALAEAPAASPPVLRQASRPAAEPAPATPVRSIPVAPAQASVPAPTPAQAALPIEPAPTVPPAARTAASVGPARVAIPLPPSRTETVKAKTVKAKTEQPARFVSLPAPKAREAAGTEAKAVASKPDTTQSEAGHRLAPPARNRTAEAQPAQTASAQAPAPQPAQDAPDEPELLGVKIPGGRQIREGWDSAVNGLLGGQ
ncbi:MAG: hypothetical protein PGN25_21655 [Methylorubrum populi]